MIKKYLMFALFLSILILFIACEKQKTLELTPVEEAWLNKHRNKVDVLFGYEAPPNAFYNDMNEYVGLLPDYADEISDKLGISFNFRLFKTWNELIEYSKDHNNFVIVGIAKTSDRSTYLSFSNTFIEIPYVIVVKQNSDINSMQDLKNKLVCTVRNYAINDFLAENYPEMSPLPVVDNLEGLRKVSTGIYDAVIINQMYASYIIEKQGITNLRVADESKYINPLSVAVSNRDPIMSSIISKAVNAIDQKKRDKLFRRWVNISGSESELNSFVIVIISFLSLIVLTAILFWVVKLRKQLRLKLEEASESKSRYTMYLDNAPVGVFLVNRLGKFLEINAAFVKMTGFSSEYLLSRSLSDIFSIEEYQKFNEKLFSMVSRDHTVLTVGYERADGKTNYWTINATTDLNDELLCFAIDITENIEREKLIENRSLELIREYRKSEEQRLNNVKILNELNVTAENLKQEVRDRKNIESALIQSEEKFRKLVENLGEGIALIDSKGVFHFTNPMMKDIFGTDESLLERSIFDFVLENEHTAFAYHSIFNKTEKIKRYNLTIIAEDGTEKILSVVSSYHGINDFSGDSNLYIFSDITEMIEEQDAMVHSSKMDAIGQLAGGVAHDFNNMLTGIIGSADVLKRLMKDDDSESVTFVDLITQTAERASELTSKLLAFSRKASMEKISVNMKDVLNDTKVILSRSLDKKTKIDLQMGDKDFYVDGDYTQLQNVFMNLGINSSHAMPDGGVITFSIDSVTLDEESRSMFMFEMDEGKYHRICVRDTGVGIREENLKRIFEPFYTTKDKNKGTGLGLAAVYGTVQEHNGAITVQSELGKGTEFCIYLPATGKLDQDDIESSDVVKGSGGILVIDDEEVIITTFRIMLEDLGYDVYDSESGHEGIKIYKLMKNQIDLVILDLVMPEMSGEEVFDEIKKTNPDAKILITSGYNKDKESETHLVKEADGFLRKPYKIAKLSKIISEILKK